MIQYRYFEYNISIKNSHWQDDGDYQNGYSCCFNTSRARFHACYVIICDRVSCLTSTIKTAITIHIICIRLITLSCVYAFVYIYRIHTVICTGVTRVASASKTAGIVNAVCIRLIAVGRVYIFYYIDANVCQAVCEGWNSLEVWQSHN